MFPTKKSVSTFCAIWVFCYLCSLMINFNLLLQPQYRQNVLGEAAPNTVQKGCKACKPELYVKIDLRGFFENRFKFQMGCMPFWKPVPDGAQRGCLKASHSENPAGYFVKRLEIQNSHPWDLCETCMCVLEYCVYAGAVLGNTCYVGFFMEMLNRIVFYIKRCCKFILMGIFIEIPHKFCTYEDLVVFIFLVCRWLICVVNKRWFLFNTDIDINNRYCDLQRFLIF